MKVFRNVMLSAVAANAFFFSSCKYPSRNRPSPAEVQNVGFFDGTLVQGILLQEDDWAIEPKGFHNSPTTTGRIENIAEMNQALRAAYNDKDGNYGPTSISRATVHVGSQQTDIYLILIAGTEPFGFPWEVSNNAIANVQIFFDAEADSNMRNNAKYAILNEVPYGSKIVIGGHSQGGMIAQQLSSDDELKDRYTFVRTLTFGSPHTPLKAGMEGDMVMFQSPADPVPKIDEVADAIYDACSWFFPWFCPPKVYSDPVTHTIPGHFKTPIQAHVCDYCREGAAGADKFDAMGDAGTAAVITFDPAQRVFWTAPTDTCVEY